jgi:enoyl-CoA hydratase
MTTTEILVTDPAPGVRLIMLNRPDALNALNHPMYERLHELIRELRNDLSVRAVVLTGAGRGFTAGHDLRAPSRSTVVPEDYGQIQRNVLTMSLIGGLITGLKALPQPVIAAVKGPVAGIGYSLALAADMIIAGQSVRFVNAFHNAATGCEGGLSWLLPRAVGTQKAAEILFTGRPILAEEAEKIGLALKVVPDEALIASALELAADISANSPLGIALTKQALWHNLQGASLEQAIAFEHRGAHVSQATADAGEKMRAFQEKRPPDFKNT